MALTDLIILGSGPAGLTAAIYAVRGGLKTTVVEGPNPGGQLIWTTEVENYPGFPEPIMGPELMNLFRKQVERLGAEFISGEATNVDFSKRPLKIIVDNTDYEADAVIVATGASARLLGLESEQRLRGKGISYCATCDGYFFKNKDVMVVGGGDTAIEDAIFLSNIARSVTVVHRRDELRAIKIIRERVFKIKNIKFLWSHVVKEICGEKKVEGVRLLNLKNEGTQEYRCDGVFIAIGYIPNTGIFKVQLELNEAGYIKVQNNTETAKEGVFVAGDVADWIYRQAVTSAGSGCQAAIDAIKYLEYLKE
ncbi:thioredoxin-disulfide reductase [Candidatus Bathyarchaeota archaeon RBG_13_38_9]|nr:MAG: thioredoxin-disulfide reductase [Candidatus Bathyarchaeota archaeon RBG_13_38_9]